MGKPQLKTKSIGATWGGTWVERNEWGDSRRQAVAGELEALQGEGWSHDLLSDFSGSASFTSAFSYSYPLI